MRLLPPSWARRASVVLAAAFLLSACGAGTGVVAAPEDSQGEEMRGRTFLSTEVTTGGKPRQLVDGTRVRLAFTEDGRLVADAGCNSMQGTVDLGEGTIAVDNLAATEIGCHQALHEQDAWLAELLARRPTWRLEGDRLVVSGGGTTLTLLDRRIADPDRPLVGTLWIVDTLIDGEVASSTVSTVGADTPDATLQIVEEGAVLGSTGCNQFRGSATVSGSTITFGEVIATRRACEPEVTKVERHILAVLDGEVRFGIEGGQLRLDHPGGKGLVLRADDAGAQGATDDDSARNDDGATDDDRARNDDRATDDGSPAAPDGAGANGTGADEATGEADEATGEDSAENAG